MRDYSLMLSFRPEFKDESKRNDLLKFVSQTDRWIGSIIIENSSQTV